MIHPPMLELIITTIISKLKSHKTQLASPKYLKIKIRKLTYKEIINGGFSLQMDKKRPARADLI